jgi:hypothetical protein
MLTELQFLGELQHEVFQELPAEARLHQVRVMEPHPIRQWSWPASQSVGVQKMNIFPLNLRN